MYTLHVVIILRGSVLVCVLVDVSLDLSKNPEAGEHRSLYTRVT